MLSSFEKINLKLGPKKITWKQFGQSNHLLPAWKPENRKQIVTARQSEESTGTRKETPSSKRNKIVRSPYSSDDENLEGMALQRFSGKKPYSRRQEEEKDEKVDFVSLLTKNEATDENWLRPLKFIPFVSMFILGIGAGVYVSSVLNVEPKNVASREVIDEATPNPNICMAYGMSAMVLDQRLFITFNPFNVYVSQAEVKPGCVLRRSNWQVLESRKLVDQDQLKDCKRNLNTFGFVGDLRESPEVSCVYHSEQAENQFLKDPRKAILGDGFTPRDDKMK